MTATLTDSAAASPLVLIHGPAKASASYAQGNIGESLAFATAQAVSSRPLIRADYPLVTPRGNHAGTLAFAAVREFSTVEAAALWGGMASCQPACRGVAVTTSYVWQFGKAEIDVAEE